MVLYLNEAEHAAGGTTSTAAGSNSPTFDKFVFVCSNITFVYFSVDSHAGPGLRYFDVSAASKASPLRLVWSGSNTPVMQGRHICAQSESERAASSSGVVPVGPCMCCFSFPPRRRRPGYRCPYTYIAAVLREQPLLGHSIVSSL